jgi:hypothetical protein
VAAVYESWAIGGVTGFFAIVGLIAALYGGYAQPRHAAHC